MSWDENLQTVPDPSGTEHAPRLGAWSSLGVTACTYPGSGCVLVICAHPPWVRMHHHQLCQADGDWAFGPEVTLALGGCLVLRTFLFPHLPQGTQDPIWGGGVLEAPL